MNMERVRQRNRSLILRFINNKGAASRKEIALASGLTQASVTQITTALIAEGILKEAGRSDEKAGSPGRREVLLRIDAGKFLTFAVNTEPDKTTAAICDIMGNVVSVKGTGPLCVQFPTEKDTDPARFLDRVCRYCEELKEQLPKRSRGRIECFSFAVTGIVDRERGISRRAYGIWKEEVDVRAIIGEKLGLPVLTENNVDAFAIAELLLGTGRKHDDMLVIKWGPGVGSSVIIGGNVYRGRHGKTPELGHLIIDPGGRKCVCGRRGCLETIVSAKALDRAGSENEKHEAIDQFARSIVNAGTILEPCRIVLFGSLADKDELRNELISRCAFYDQEFGEKRILHTSLSGRECYIGPAAVYTMHRIMSRPVFSSSDTILRRRFL